MRIKNRRFSITIPTLGLIRVEKLENLGWRDPWKETYIIAGEVNGEHKGAIAIIVKDLPTPMQISSEELYYSNILWIPESELELPIKESISINLPPESVNWNRIVEIFAHAYITNVLLHEFLHLFVRFESKEIDDMLGAESEDIYNVIEDFLIQILLLKKAGIIFKPSWVTSQQELLTINSPSLIGKIHVIKVLQNMSCNLSKIGVFCHEGFTNVALIFSEPNFKNSSLNLIQEVLIAELIAYMQLLELQRFSQHGNVKIDIVLPTFIQNTLTNITREKRMLQNLVEQLINFGNTFIKKSTLKHFKDLYQTLVDYIAFRLI